MLVAEASLFLVLLAFAAEPDIDNPFSPIYFDKESYSWTDKVKIMIVAPSWNAHKYAIDTIGDDSEHFIKVSTREHDIEPYKLTETDLNSGIFVGEVILTGFLHDADGDGNFDTAPKTSGTGPTNGFLEAGRDDAITVSFEFTENRVVTETALINWNIARVEFLQERYLVDQQAIIRVVDSDMNLNPEAVDQFEIDVVSDSDPAGVKTKVIETSEDSGLFEGKISFTQKSASSGSRIFASPGDHVIGKYEDNTLPSPYGKSDDLEISASMVLESNTPPLERASLSGISITDSMGNKPSTLNATNQLQITGNVVNLQDFDQDFVLISQITNEDNYVVSLSWIQGQMGALQTIGVSQSWVPKEAGTYTVETFVWNSLNKSVPLVLPQSESYFVRE